MLRFTPVLLLAAAVAVSCQGPAPRGPAAATPPPAAKKENSPASQRPPATAVVQQYPAAQIEAGRTFFGAQCAFCHGRDAAGGETGPDLTRSAMVAADVRGDKLAPHLRAGRIEKGMPAFPTLPAENVAAIVAFIHDQKTKAESAEGGRRSVDLADLQTGDAAAGQRYFDTACARCHSSTGDLAGVASRHQGLPLLRRMLYPTRTSEEASKPAPQTVRVTLRTGQVITGHLAQRDEFTIALIDADGWPRSWPADQVSFTVDDPLEAHVRELEKYTDKDMHDVLAYLQTLKNSDAKAGANSEARKP